LRFHLDDVLVVRHLRDRKRDAEVVAAREALELLSEAGVKARFVQVVYLEPFPGEEVRRELAKGSTNVLFENNATAQLGELIRLHASYGFDHVGLRYDGRPFNPSDIRDKVMEVLGR
jgi:2-oxoglutarate ferredoxin oxidoreductase subunit alpha